MRAMVMTGVGPAAKTLELRDVPTPEPEAGDLLVAVHACGLNPVDTKVRRAISMPRQGESILGFDVSGVVAKVGKDVKGFKEGDEVYASPSLARNGSNAEFVCIDARTAALKPRNVDHQTAAAIPLALLTAWESLHDRAEIKPWETILMHAGAGGVGHFGLQLAKLHGCRVITTAGRDETIAFCKQLGADLVINYREEDFVKRVQDETDAKGCPVVFDTVGGETFEKSLDCVAINGRLVMIVHSPADQVINKLFRKNVTFHLEFMGIAAIHGINAEHNREILTAAARLVEAGKLMPHIHKVYPLDQLAAAHEEQETGRVIGKIVIAVK